MLENHELSEFLYQALRSDHGIVLTTNNPEVTRGRLARLQRDDPDLAKLKVTISKTAPQNEVWIIKKEKKSGS